MSLHANRGLYHRAVLHARQDTSTKGMVSFVHPSVDFFLPVVFLSTRNP